jgi:hypothetical protein
MLCRPKRDDYHHPVWLGHRLTRVASGNLACRPRSRVAADGATPARRALLVGPQFRESTRIVVANCVTALVLNERHTDALRSTGTR